MATTAITPTPLVMNTVSADLPDASGTAATTPADGWVIDADGLNGDRLLLKFLADDTGDTVVIAAGDNPPSHRAGLGSLSIVLAANDVRYVTVEAGRFVQNDGAIHATCGDAGTTCRAFIMPKGLAGSAR